MSVFVDASAFYAAVDAGDSAHSRARIILGSGERLVTSDHVLVETWRLISGRAGFHAAEKFWQAIRDGLAVVESIGPGDLDAAWRIGETFPDQDFSIVDRTSFALMQRLRVNRVASFDDHFAIYRFGSGRQQAFEVLR